MRDIIWWDTGVLLFWIAVFIVSPFLSIWALNTLFGFAIPYTLKTWAAALVLELSIKGVSYNRKVSNV